VGRGAAPGGHIGRRDSSRGPDAPFQGRESGTNPSRPTPSRSGDRSRAALLMTTSEEGVRALGPDPDRAGGCITQVLDGRETMGCIDGSALRSRPNVQGWPGPGACHPEGPIGAYRWSTRALFGEGAEALAGEKAPTRPGCTSNGGAGSAIGHPARARFRAPGSRTHAAATTWRRRRAVYGLQTIGAEGPAASPNQRDDLRRRL